MFTDGLDTRQLNKETRILEQEIRALYREFDQRFHLNAAELDIRFDYAEDALGAYVSESAATTEHFLFSAVYCVLLKASDLKQRPRGPVQA